MKKEFQERLEAYQKESRLNIMWFERFFTLLEECGIEDEKISKLMDIAFTPEHTRACGSDKVSYLFTRYPSTPALINGFFDYLDSVRREEGEKGFHDFLERTVDGIHTELARYESEDHHVGTNIANLFIRGLVNERKQDVKLVSTKTPMAEINPRSNEGHIDAVIGGVSVGHIRFETAVTSEPNIQFTEFRTLPGLERMGIGVYIFREFCRQINEHKPGYSVIAFNVMKNRDGSKVYTKWGAYPINTTVSNDVWQIDTRHLSQQELDEWQEGTGALFYFPPETIKSIGQSENATYGDAYKEKQEVTTEDNNTEKKDAGIDKSDT